MWFEMSDAFRAQAAKYKLAFACEDCVHFCSEREDCDIAYPCAPHRRAHIEQLGPKDRVFFCKMFEAR